MKCSYVQYDTDFKVDCSVQTLRIYLPSEKGYVNYNIMRSVSDERFLDTWRLGQALAYDDNFENKYALTPTYAEWDMAVRIENRDDFIGGYAHGDEYFTEMSFKIDGEAVDITSLTEKTKFELLEIEVKSFGTDPADHKTVALDHVKLYKINSNGITLYQKVDWRGEYVLESAFLAMMPPSKTLTDTVSVNDGEGVPIEMGMKVKHCRKAVVYGEKSKIYYEMSTSEYPNYDDGTRLSITDNGNGGYNKMYFGAVEHKSGFKVKKGDVWNSVTQYNIKML